MNYMEAWYRHGAFNSNFFSGELIHGKTTQINHDSCGLFENVPQSMYMQSKLLGIECTRYHSLAGEVSTLPDCLVVTSSTPSGVVMGVRHKIFVIEGVQVKYV
jgi:anthranilate/para-aminobenzoate synthase component II